MLNYKFRIIFVLIILFLLSGCYNSSNGKVVNDISSRLKTTPSWDAILDQLIIRFKPGITRNDVHDILNLIGPWKIDLLDPPEHAGWDSDSKQWVIREIIYFDEENTKDKLGDLYFSYNLDYVLVDWEIIDKY